MIFSLGWQAYTNQGFLHVCTQASVKPIEVQGTKSSFLFVFGSPKSIFMAPLCGKVFSISRGFNFQCHIFIDLNLEVPFVHVISTTNLLCSLIFSCLLARPILIRTNVMFALYHRWCARTIIIMLFIYWLQIQMSIQRPFLSTILVFVKSDGVHRPSFWIFSAQYWIVETFASFFFLLLFMIDYEDCILL